MSKLTLYWAERGDYQVVDLAGLSEITLAHLEEFGFGPGSLVSKLSHTRRGVVIDTAETVVLLDEALTRYIGVEPLENRTGDSE